MSIDLTSRVLAPREVLSHRTPSRADRRRERNRLAHADRRAARLAELHLMQGVLQRATTLVSSGWVQHAWYSRTGGDGQRSLVTAHQIHVMADETPSGACLVGAIVHAAGGPATATSQLVQRTLDLTWHALFEHPQAPVRWCPPPAVRMAHVRDLTRWNDHSSRSAEEVGGLLRTAARTASVQTALVTA